MTSRTNVVVDFWLHLTTTVVEPANHPDGGGGRVPVGVFIASSHRGELEEVKSLGATETYRDPRPGFRDSRLGGSVS